MNFPTIVVLERLMPDLFRLAYAEKTNPQQIQHFVKCAARLWVIWQSLYNLDSQFYLDQNQLISHSRSVYAGFKCAAWEKLFGDRLPNYQQKSLVEFLLAESSSSDCQLWQTNLAKRYSIDNQTLQQLLTSSIFSVDSRTIRNDFKRLAQLKQPLLQKIVLANGKTVGEYQKSTNKIDLNPTIEPILNTVKQQNSLDSFKFLHEGLSTITDLLFTKINGYQRLFIHTEYIVNQELQERADDWANDLTDIWKAKAIVPIKINYASASCGNQDEYIVYPVCLYYHQRAYYLCAFGERPHHSEKQFGWYNFRLERIINLEKKTWSDCQTSQAIKASTHQQEQIKDEYTPDYIQTELDRAYGFDFYRDRATMLLRFNRDFAQRYIQNTERHATFTELSSKAAESWLIQQLETEENNVKQKQSQLLNRLDRASDDPFYLLDYRVGDNSVIMRLRAWCPNVEVVYPWNLRQRMREDMEKTWRIYESDK